LKCIFVGESNNHAKSEMIDKRIRGLKGIFGQDFQGKRRIQELLHDAKRKSNNESFSHSKDFRSIRLKNKEYSLTERQSEIVQILYEAYKEGTSEVGEQYILEHIGSPNSRLRDSLRTGNLWGTLVIRGNSRGSIRLNL